MSDNQERLLGLVMIVIAAMLIVLAIRSDGVFDALVMALTAGCQFGVGIRFLIQGTIDGMQKKPTELRGKTETPGKLSSEPG